MHQVESATVSEQLGSGPRRWLRKESVKITGRQQAWLVALLALLYFAALVSRNPDILRLPQFWAEDGQIFYQQAHALGFLHSVWLQYGGYVHLLSRVVAAISLLVPVADAPLVFAVAALIIQSLPAIYLSSPRMQNAGPLWIRILLSVLYLGVPNVGEVHGVLLNADRHFAVLCVLVLVAPPSKCLAATIFDYVVLCAGAFTGPYPILLVPVALLIYRTRREPRTLRQLIILGVGVLVQGSLVLLFRLEGGTSHGASLSAFCRIFAFQVIVPVFRGTNPTWHSHYAAHPGLWAAEGYAITFVALAALLYIFVRGSLPVRCMVLFGAEVFACALISSTGTQGHAWQLFQQPSVGQRYWYIPELAVTAATVWLVTRAQKIIPRVGAACVLCLLLYVDFHHWAVYRVPYAHWDRYAAEFRALPVGAHIKVPINPLPSWSVELTKTSRDR